MKIGTRVEVWNGDQSKRLGFGKYEGETVVRGLFVMTRDRGPVLYTHKDDPTREVPVPPGLPEDQYQRFESTTPMIRLDSGEVVLGSSTWWRPVDDGIESAD